ncbi:tetratricopeptide repeat protein [Spirosoma sordidisoli]|uniref:Tetratricopeptide repeat protein n=1 Tax=Spirosoma sordidisoli TaxID=2502893 RepID=A0A4Q2UKW3_9BACT|nr:tetratricopeptide repeat protein [Spirosoma sordidisoli]RYC68115.1 tetratricopeptide repeat protein [Spirosoma sordidisoli]
MNSIKRLSELTIQQDRKATLQFLVNKVKQRKDDFPAPPFFLLMGAGCSFDARIPTGSGIMTYLQKRCYVENTMSIPNHNLLDLDKIDSLLTDDDAQKNLAAFIKEKQEACHQQVDAQRDEFLGSIPADLVEILKTNNPDADLWDVVKEEFYQTSYYGFWFDITLPDPRERQQLIEEIIDRKEPSAAYILLACVVNSDGIRTIFTTNFDDLVNDAILQETDKKSRIYAHNELVKFINFRSPRPNIVKLHGDYLFQDMKNTLHETSTLQDDQIMKLQEAAQDMGVIVTGYSGSDRSIMDALYQVKEKRGASFPLYWCARDEKNINWRAKYLINQHPNSYYVPVDTFEQLIVKLYNDLNCKLRDVEEKKKWVEKHHQKAVDTLSKGDLRKQSPNLEKALKAEEILAQARQIKTPTERVTYLDDMIQKVPPNAELYVWNAYYKHDLQRYEDALTDLDKAIDLDSTNATAYNNRGSAKSNLQRYEDALIDLDKAIDLDPNNSSAHNNRGFAKNSLKRYEEALSDYEKAIDLDPNNDAAYINRGSVNSYLKQYKDALIDFDKAIDLDPTDATTYSHKGRTLRKLNRLTEAEENVRRAIELDENYANAYANLAEIRAAQGNADGYYESLETALAKGANVENRFTDEVYIPYLTEPRFVELLKKHGIPQPA